MNNITIIMPVHLYDQTVDELMKKAIGSVVDNTQTYEGQLTTMIVCPTNILDDIKKFVADFKENSDYKDITVIENTGDTDFCSQVNYGAQHVNDTFFSILEFDDQYAKNWFKMAYDYYFSNEDVSVFLPINVTHNSDMTKWQFGNEIIWASSFSNEIGYIDFDCLSNCSTFNLTGGIFNTNDFIRIGMLKPSIKVAFNYEFLLRATDNHLRIFVVPKEGYIHTIGREGSLTEIYESTMNDDDIKKWFNAALREYPYLEDRKKGINDVEPEKIK